MAVQISLSFHAHTVNLDLSASYFQYSEECVCLFNKLHPDVLFLLSYIFIVILSYWFIWSSMTRSMKASIIVYGKFSILKVLKHMYT